jgi:hypothetical protein
MHVPKSYTEKLATWGESGAFYPNLIPSEADAVQLRKLQYELHGVFPNSTVVEKLHATVFFIHPQKACRDFAELTPDGLDPEGLYMDLSCVFATAMLTYRGMTLPTVGLERFGEGKSVLALQLGATADWEHFAGPLRELVILASRRNGVTQEAIKILRTRPDYRWLFAPSTPHVSLLTGIGEGEIPNHISLPTQITFEGISDGSVSAPVEDWARWYLIPDTQDPD